MSNTYTLDSINQIHDALGLAKPKHPLISIIQAKDIQQPTAFQDIKIILNLYQIALKQGTGGTLKYGRNSYDFQEGTLVFMAPGQVIEYQSDDKVESDNLEGWTLCFHPDLIRKSDLADTIHQYSFFNYAVNEALHLSEEEIKTIEEILDKIVKEYSQNLDKHSHHLIVSNIKLLLDYCLRFYDRQFYTRSSFDSDLISNFEKLLKDYYQSSKVQEFGIPTVNYCGQTLNLSPNYLSDLLKKETGKTAQEHIHLCIIERAKNSLLNSTHSISEISYALGFDYPQYFSNLFKSKTGLSPREYRNLN